jgi:putative Mg2+ transporter-C (MgtC) family protein
MPVVAAIGTTLHLVAVTFLPRVLHRFAPGVAGEQVALVQYREGRGALRSVLQKAAAEQFQVTFESAREIGDDGERPRIEARLRFAPSRRPLDRLIAEMAEVPGVTWVSLDEQEE